MAIIAQSAIEHINLLNNYDVDEKWAGSHTHTDL